MRGYQHGNAEYGQRRFEYDAPVGDFYAAYLLAGLLGTALFILSILALVLAAAIGRAVGPPSTLGLPTQGMLASLTLGFVFVYTVVIIAVQSLLTVRVQNLVWNRTYLAGHRFVYRLGVVRLFWVRLTNLVATLATLGLFRPFAQVRLARYMASVFVVVPGGSLDDFVAAESPDVTAVGEGAADAFDFDIAF
jgi:uncharacterized membrane protein YjgN (DUF898 family)